MHAFIIYGKISCTESVFPEPEQTADMVD